MSAAKSPLQIELDQIIKSSVTEVLKPAGFRKKALNWHRRFGETVQVLNVQMSAGCSWDTKIFYINVGIAFDAVCRHMGKEILETPKESECDHRGFRQRNSALVPETPAQWRLLDADDDKTVAKFQEDLRNVIEVILAELNRIQTVHEFSDHDWMEKNQTTKAQILYLSGRFDDAWHVVQEKAQAYADKDHPKWAALRRPETWLEKWNMTDLPKKVG